MLYLIRSWGKNKSLLKIGFTNDIKKRMDNYYHSNPLYEPIGTRDGTLIEEKKLHLYLELLGYKHTKLDEWFIDNPNIPSLFHDSISKINSTLWKNRDKIWKKDDLLDGSDKRLRTIFDELNNLYKPENTNLTDIDRDYVFIKAKEYLKTNKYDDLYW